MMVFLYQQHKNLLKNPLLIKIANTCAEKFLFETIIR